MQLVACQQLYTAVEQSSIEALLASIEAWAEKRARQAGQPVDGGPIVCIESFPLSSRFPGIAFWNLFVLLQFKICVTEPSNLLYFQVFSAFQLCPLFILTCVLLYDTRCPIESASNCPTTCQAPVWNLRRLA